MKFFLLSLSAALLVLNAQAKTITLTSDNTIVLDKSVDAYSVGQVMAQAKKIDSKLKSEYPIYLFLKTPGGSIQSGVELIEFLNGLNRPVHTVTLFAASMGFQIVQHMKKRYVIKYGVLMSHKARGSFKGDFGGTISQVDTRYAMWLRRIKMMDEHTVSRTKGKQTLDSYINSYSPELWLNGLEAVSQGYADEVVEVKCDSSLSGTKKIENDLGFYKSSIEVPVCPVQTGIVGSSSQILTNHGYMELSAFLQKNGTFGQCPNDPSQDTVCAKDPGLTLEKIKAQEVALIKEHSKSLEDSVVYSY